MYQQAHLSDANFLLFGKYSSLEMAARLRCTSIRKFSRIPILQNIYNWLIVEQLVELYSTLYTIMLKIWNAVSWRGKNRLQGNGHNYVYSPEWMVRNIYFAIITCLHRFSFHLTLFTQWTNNNSNKKKSHKQ